MSGLGLFDTCLAIITKNLRYLKGRNPEPYFWLFWGWVNSRIHKPYSLYRSFVPPFEVPEMFNFEFSMCFLVEVVQP